MKILNIADLPFEVLDFFENNSRQFQLFTEYQPKNFKRFMLVNYNNGDKTYIANQIKKYSSAEVDNVEDLSNLIEDVNYLIDYRGEENIGHGELRYCFLNNSDVCKNKPFVGNTATEKKYQKTGLGLRRLFLLNALSKTLYNYPLNSDEIITDQAKNLWENLVKEGKAKKYKEEKSDRYVMLN
jgi:hypothetical protein